MAGNPSAIPEKIPPIQTLKRSIILSILSHLSLTELQKCQLISRKWNALITASKELDRLLFKQPPIFQPDKVPAVEDFTKEVVLHPVLSRLRFKSFHTEHEVKVGNGPQAASLVNLRVRLAFVTSPATTWLCLKIFDHGQYSYRGEVKIEIPSGITVWEFVSHVTKFMQSNTLARFGQHFSEGQCLKIGQNPGSNMRNCDFVNPTSYFPTIYFAAPGSRRTFVADFMFNSWASQPGIVFQIKPEQSHFSPEFAKYLQFVEMCDPASQDKANIKAEKTLRVMYDGEIRDFEIYEFDQDDNCNTSLDEKNILRSLTVIRKLKMIDGADHFVCKVHVVKQGINSAGQSTDIPNDSFLFVLWLVDSFYLTTYDEMDEELAEGKALATGPKVELGNKLKDSSKGGFKQARLRNDATRISHSLSAAANNWKGNHSTMPRNDTREMVHMVTPHLLESDWDSPPIYPPLTRDTIFPPRQGKKTAKAPTVPPHASEESVRVRTIPSSQAVVGKSSLSRHLIKGNTKLPNNTSPAQTPQGFELPPGFHVKGTAPRLYPQQLKQDSRFMAPTPLPKLDAPAGPCIEAVGTKNLTTTFNFAPTRTIPKTRPAKDPHIKGVKTKFIPPPGSITQTTPTPANPPVHEVPQGFRIHGAATRSLQEVGPGIQSMMNSRHPTNSNAPIRPDINHVFGPLVPTGPRALVHLNKFQSQAPREPRASVDQGINYTLSIPTAQIGQSIRPTPPIHIGPKAQYGSQASRSASQPSSFPAGSFMGPKAGAFPTEAHASAHYDFHKYQNEYACRLKQAMVDSQHSSPRVHRQASLGPISAGLQRSWSPSGLDASMHSPSSVHAQLGTFTTESNRKKPIVAGNMFQSPNGHGSVVVTGGSHNVQTHFLPAKPPRPNQISPRVHRASVSGVSASMNVSSSAKTGHTHRALVSGVVSSTHVQSSARPGHAQRASLSGTIASANVLFSAGLGTRVASDNWKPVARKTSPNAGHVSSLTTVGSINIQAHTKPNPQVQRVSGVNAPLYFPSAAAQPATSKAEVGVRGDNRKFVSPPGLYQSSSGENVSSTSTFLNAKAHVSTPQKTRRPVVKQKISSASGENQAHMAVYGLPIGLDAYQYDNEDDTEVPHVHVRLDEGGDLIDLSETPMKVDVQELQFKPAAEQSLELLPRKEEELSRDVKELALADWDAAFG